MVYPQLRESPHHNGVARVGASHQPPRHEIFCALAQSDTSPNDLNVCCDKRDLMRLYHLSADGYKEELSLARAITVPDVRVQPVVECTGPIGALARVSCLQANYLPGLVVMGGQ